MRSILTRLQRGFTLIEALAALSVASIAMVGIASSMNDTIEETRSMTAIQYLSEFNVAAGRYVNLNTATYLDSSQKPAVTNMIDVQTLKDGGFLTTAFQDSNVYGQTPCLIIRRSFTPSNIAILEAMMLTVNLTDSGFKVPKKLYTSIAAKAGIGIASNPADGKIATEATGMGGAWRQSLTGFDNTLCGNKGTTTKLNATATNRLQFASLLTSNALAVTSAPYLYRGVISSSNLELNQMLTDLDMAGGGTKHSLANIENITANTAAIANNATVGTLGVGGNATVGGALNVTGATTLSTTNVNGLLNATNGQNITGNLTVSGQVSANSAALTNQLTTKDIIVTRDIDSYGSITVLNGDMGITNGNLTVKGDNVFHRINTYYQQEQSGTSEGWMKCPNGQVLVSGGINCRDGWDEDHHYYNYDLDVVKSHPDGDNTWRYKCTGSGRPTIAITCME